MNFDIGSRFFYSFLLIYLSFLFIISPGDPRPYFRTLSYILGGAGILRLFINWTLGFQIKGRLLWLGESFSVESFQPLVRRLDRVFLGAFCILLMGSFLYHFTEITWMFRNSFFLGERDFTSMGEIILNASRELGFYSAFHGDGNSSYLSHHFSPGIIAYIPFFRIFDDRIALAWGQVFFSLMIAICLVQLLRRSEKDLPIKGHIIWLLLVFGNIYLYRLALSYHFEILFVFYFLLLYWVRNSLQEILAQPHDRAYYMILGKFIVWETSILILILSVKEDTAIYLCLFYLGEGIAKFFPRNQSRIGLVGKDFGYAFLLLIYYSVGLPSLRGIMGVEPDENWYAIWGHWLDETNSISPSFWLLVKSIIASPMEVFHAIASKGNTIWEISLGFGFLFYLAPRYWFYIISVMFIHFLSGREWHNSFYNYYIYTLLPVLWIASLEGYRKLIHLSFPKTGFALGFLVLALVMHRNAGDKNFPFSSESIPSGQHLLSEKERAKKVLEVEILSGKISDGSKVATQFDLGIFVSPKSNLYPIQKNPKVWDPERKEKVYPDYILTNALSGFSPYVNLETITLWEKGWIKDHGYKVIHEQGDFRLFIHDPPNSQ